MDALNLIYIIIFALAGVIIGYLVRQSIAQKRANSIESKIKNQLEQARVKVREMVLSAKDKATGIIESAQNEERERKKELLNFEKQLNRREEILNQKISESESQRKELEVSIEKLKSAKLRIEDMKIKADKEMERISGLSKEEAKEEVFKNITEENRLETTKLLQRLEKEKRDEIEKQANEIMMTAIQRFSRSNYSETTTSAVSIPSEDIKGKIIGKEGRNIRALERATGVDFIIDESPDTITVSCFDPARREVAKLALEKLIRDGRIQPARIEEKVEEARQEVNEVIRKAGEEAVYEVGILDLPKEIVYLLGRLKFRTSYGQNVLQHSIEASHLSGIIAAELGASIETAKKAALLHDIGKAIDHEVEGTHVELGRKILQKYKLPDGVIKAMQPHHDDYPFETPESFIVAAAEATSAGRVGARRDTFEKYIKRLEELEKIAMDFESVNKAYAIRAGREIRVFVTPDKIDDLGAINLAKEIANRIQGELNYPGEIKVNVIRELRAVEYAK